MIRVHIYWYGKFDKIAYYYNIEESTDIYNIPTLLENI
jgi:hypothetical protein